MRDQKNNKWLSAEQCRDMGRECVFLSLRKTSRAVTAFYDLALQDSGLNASQLAILAIITEQKTCTMGRLAEILKADPSTLTRNVAVLERRQLVQLNPGQDRRKRILSITDLGSDHLAQAYPLWQQTQQALQQVLGEEALQKALLLLKQLRKAAS